MAAKRDPAGPASGESRDRWVCVGVIAGAHGVAGEVKLKSFTDEPTALKQLKGLVRGKEALPVEITESRLGNELLIARLKGIASREAALAIKGERLFVPRSNLPAPEEDEFYHADLIGMRVRDSMGKDVGKIAGVQNFGAGDLLEIALDRPRRFVGKSPLVPFERETVPEVDVEHGEVTVHIDEWINSWIDATKPDEGSES